MHVERPPRTRSLEEDFFDFIQNGLGALSLDLDGDKFSRPDYLLDDDLLIEVKNLEASPSQKISAALTHERTSTNWPLAFGKMGPQHFEKSGILDRNKKELLKKTQSAIRKDLQRANKQFIAHSEREGKRFASVMILLNENHIEYTPDMVGHAIFSEMKSGERAGRTSYSNLDAVIYVTERHYTTLAAPPFAAYTVMQLLNADPHPEIGNYLNKISSGWATRGSSPPITVYGIPKPAPPGIIEIVEPKMAQSELWRLNYRRDPYMKDFSHSQISSAFFANTMKFSLRFIKGAPRAGQGHDPLELQESTEILEELSLRGTNMLDVIPTPKVLKMALREVRPNRVEEKWLRENFQFTVGSTVYKIK